MLGATYQQRRSELRVYFDETAADTWARLTSSAKVSRIRATVRAGREEMRNTLLSWLPADLTGQRLLDAGCGTGALAVAAAERGASVLGIELATRLVELARARAPHDLMPEPEFIVGDMLDPLHGVFDFVVAMDSLIHYRSGDCVAMLADLATHARCSVLFTFAPRTAPLTVMHTVGRLFPRRNRAPSIVPIRETTLRERVAAEPRLAGWRIGRTYRVTRGFYKSQAMELVKR
jgi:magnesium-protoporphyrin O-methyltransferase